MVFAFLILLELRGKWLVPVMASALLFQGWLVAPDILANASQENHDGRFDKAECEKILAAFDVQLRAIPQGKGVFFLQAPNATRLDLSCWVLGEERGVSTPILGPPISPQWATELGGALLDRASAENLRTNPPEHPFLRAIAARIPALSQHAGSEPYLFVPLNL